MEQRSLKVMDSNKTFFSKLTNTLTKILIPTRLGINGMLVSAKRNNVVKAYESYKEYTKDDQKKKETLLIYAKEEETALKILDIYNTDNDFIFDKPRFGYQKIVRIEMNPTDLVNQQMDTAEQKLIERRMAKGL